MRIPTLVLIAFALVAAPSAGPAAQAPEPVPVIERVEPAADTPPATGIPARYTPPRTLRAYWHLFIAFAVTWVLIFGYTVLIGRRLARIERELDELRGG
jgi:CcmD family protein